MNTGSHECSHIHFFFLVEMSSDVGSFATPQVGPRDPSLRTTGRMSLFSGRSNLFSQFGELDALNTLLLHGGLSGFHHVCGLKHAHVPRGLETWADAMSSHNSRAHTHTRTYVPTNSSSAILTTSRVLL